MLRLFTTQMGAGFLQMSTLSGDNRENEIYKASTYEMVGSHPRPHQTSSGVGVALRLRPQVTWVCRARARVRVPPPQQPH